MLDAPAEEVPVEEDPVEEAPVDETLDPVGATEEPAPLTDADTAQAVEEAKKLAADPEINLTCLNLIMGRQLYTMAAVTLHRQLQSRGGSSLAEEVIVQSLAHAAGQAFDAEDLLQRVSTACLAFMHREIKAMKLANQAEEKADLEEEDRQRRALSVPLGFEICGATALGRDVPLVLAGPPKAVSHLLGLAINAAGAEPDGGGRRKVVVVHLLNQMQSHDAHVNITDKNKTYIKIGINQGVSSANSHKTFGKLLSLWQRQTYKQRVDLLVIEHAPLLYDGGISGRSQFANAASALQSISKWAQAAGCAVLAGVHCDPQEALQETSSAWETLAQHAIVRVVQVGPAPDGQEDQREIVIGDSEGRLTVAKQLLE